MAAAEARALEAERKVLQLQSELIEARASANARQQQLANGFSVFGRAASTCRSDAEEAFLDCGVQTSSADFESAEENPGAVAADDDSKSAAVNILATLAETHEAERSAWATERSRLLQKLVRATELLREAGHAPQLNASGVATPRRVGDGASGAAAHQAVKSADRVIITAATSASSPRYTTTTMTGGAAFRQPQSNSIPQKAAPQPSAAGTYTPLWRLR